MTDGLGQPIRRRWALVTVAAQVAFVLSWLVAAAWQGPDDSPVAHSISDMYALTAPHAWFLVVVLTLRGRRDDRLRLALACGRR